MNLRDQIPEDMNWVDFCDALRNGTSERSDPSAKRPEEQQVPEEVMPQEERAAS